MKKLLLTVMVMVILLTFGAQEQADAAPKYYRFRGTVDSTDISGLIGYEVEQVWCVDDANPVAVPLTEIVYDGVLYGYTFPEILHNYSEATYWQNDFLGYSGTSYVQTVYDPVEGREDWDMWYVGQSDFQLYSSDQEVGFYRVSVTDEAELVSITDTLPTDLSPVWGGGGAAVPELPPGAMQMMVLALGFGASWVRRFTT